MNYILPRLQRLFTEQFIERLKSTEDFDFQDETTSKPDRIVKVKIDHKALWAVETKNDWITHLTREIGGK